MSQPLPESNAILDAGKRISSAEELIQVISSNPAYVEFYNKYWKEKNITIIDNIQFTKVRLISKEGATSEVYSGVYNNVIYCLKKYNDFFQNEKVTEHFFREIANLFDTNCRFIVKPYAITFMDNHITLITEYCPLGALNYIFHRPERDQLSQFVPDLVLQLIKAIQYLHDRNIIHRDIKLDNIFITKPNDSFEIRLGNLGFSREILNENERLTGNVGTPEYMTPEVEKCNNGESYGKPVDIYSLGIVLVYLLSGKLLAGTIHQYNHDEANHNKYVEEVLKEIYNNSAIAYKYKNALYYVKDCLSYNPDKRPKISELYNNLKREFGNLAKYNYDSV